MIGCVVVQCEFCWFDVGGICWCFDIYFGWCFDQCFGNVGEFVGVWRLLFL